jgi:translation initiation factor IF-1|tara:strand:+ start:6561 stop:6779 length:219 start_codon:yes stop_codon:yes gene_type:complete
MGKENIITMSGMVTSILPAGMFKIKLDNGHDVIGHLSGKMRKNHIKILDNDKVDIELSTYDVTKGRIVYRYK